MNVMKNSGDNGVWNITEWLGPRSTMAHREYFGTGNAELETDYGSGSAYVHWDEAKYQNIDMTPLKGPGNDTISTLTLAAFEDMGWKIRSGRSQGYNLTETPAIVGGIVGGVVAGSKSSQSTKTRSNNLLSLAQRSSRSRSSRSRSSCTKCTKTKTSKYTEKQKK